ncbi:DUF3042 domain-containing protein [Philodulcilactobacillus myokoensis]|uniref:DUF3042 domain-containing protein n=1 Tax=Philodulcilactobacillus myokoensis TaxID=2929573 RepID=A0A9W6B1G2_9LACO|nr:DUF3042 family protein [Philodulcilactobacillus myokoensis]GLB46786.1 DUF3042 domain-containing protein [Philodulcilactobacillus myokoensis]
MKNFGKGFAAGVVATLGAVTGAFLSFKKAVVNPIEDKKDKFKQNHKRAMRKSRSVHHG